jgi:hypothetical protein
MNKFCDEYFARDLPAAIGRFFRNCPARIAILITIPLKAILGDDKKEQSRLKARINGAFATDSFPVGISAIAATLFVVMLFLFY